MSKYQTFDSPCGTRFALHPRASPLSFVLMVNRIFCRFDYRYRFVFFYMLIGCRVELGSRSIPDTEHLHHSCSIRTCTWPFHFIALLLYVQCQLRGSAECLRYHASKLDISKLSMPCIENIDIMQYIEILVFRYIEAFDTIFRYIEKIDTSIYRSFRCDNQH